MFEASAIKCGTLCLIVAGLSVPSCQVQESGAVPALAKTSQIAFASTVTGIGRSTSWMATVDARRDSPNGTLRTDFRCGRRTGRRSRSVRSRRRDPLGIGVMNADGSNPRRLASDIVAKGFRQWSHNGRRIVCRYREGNVEILASTSPTVCSPD